jgi:hypothetical protein
MIDLRLVFPDEAAGLAALAASGVEAEASGVTCGAWGVCVTGLRVVGTPAVLDEAGEVVTPPVFAPGWHADLRLMDTDTAPAALVPFVVVPAMPQYQFAQGV